MSTRRLSPEEGRQDGRSVGACAFDAELRKHAFAPLRLAMKGIGTILNPISSASRKGLMAAGGAGADLGLRGAIYPMKMLSRYVMAGNTLRNKAMRAGTAVGGGLTAYDVGQTTRRNMGGGVYRSGR